MCNPSYTFPEPLNSKRYLTTPSVPASNGGLDNEKSDLILAVNDVLANDQTHHRYIIKDLLGQGTFGQVAKCWSEDRDCFVAVKVIKNQPAYHQQAIVEVSILDMLNSKFDPEDNHQIVRMIEHFYYQEHLCIVFEMLGVNLFELLKANNFKGFSLNLIRTFTKQILKALALLRDAGIIHCDVKPENILLTTSPGSAEIKLIDFGSACREDRTVYSYIQSRFYRSPEVVLGHAYTTAIDMWSLGCVAAELFLGLPLFPAQSQYDLLQRLMKVLGGKPPDFILRYAKNTSKYFKIGRAPNEESVLMGERQHSSYQFLMPDDIRLRENEAPVIGRHYFPEDWDLEKLITSYHMKRGMSEEEIKRESSRRLVFVDFLKGLVDMDPLKRWTPNQAEQHPFLTEAPFTGPFQPPQDVPRLPIRQVMNMDHNPVTGHWFGAGLSPQVGSNHAFQFGSPQHHGLSVSYGSSYAGSYGSFVGDVGAGPGSSFGSNNGESLDSQFNYRTPPNAGLGVSPDVWRRKGHKPLHSFGYAHVGMSPSGGSYITSLGASPSNLGSPTSHFQHSPGSPSVGSSSRFGPTSPARTGGGATSLGKAAAFGQYNKRRGWGSPGSVVNANSESRNTAHDSSFPSPYTYDRSSARNDTSMNAGTESFTQNTFLDSPRSPSYYGSQFRPRNIEIAGTNSIHGQSAQSPNFVTGSSGDYIQRRGVASTKEEEALPPPTPADWDPTYSEELLFEEGDVISTDVPSVTNLLEVTGMSDTRNPGFANSASLPGSGKIGQQSMQFRPGQVATGYRPATTGPVYTDGGSPTSRGWNTHYRPYHNHHPQQISQSRLGQQSSHFDQHQQQYPFQSLSVRSSEQLPIPFSLAHPQLGHQFLAQSIQASVGPFVMPGASVPAQGMPIHNQMSPVGPPHWASGFPGQRYGPLSRAFPPIHTRKDGRTDM
ncbi:hypothetical protein GOP47_0024001 [Adiantum capillus-veneris]|nr:hypothetical protein GOP47_0024001 [Adiantum capillus-veneris]